MEKAYVAANGRDRMKERLIKKDPKKMQGQLQGMDALVSKEDELR